MKLRGSLFVVLVVGLFAAPLVTLSGRQAVNPCDQAATGPFSVASAKPYTVAWCMDAEVTVPDPDVAGATIKVPNRVDGFFVQLDTAAPIDAGKLMPAGETSAVSGKTPYEFRMASGVAKGNHTVAVWPYNAVLDANGNPTPTRQEGNKSSVPFVASDPVLRGAPFGPSKVRIKR